MGFLRLARRGVGAVLDELCLFLQRRGLVAWLVEKVEVGALPEPLMRRVVGAFEFVTAEALAAAAGLDLYARWRGGGSLAGGAYVVWNGAAEWPLWFEMAGRGVPDVEIHVGDSADLVEVTLGADSSTLLREVGEAARHKPTVGGNVRRRVVLAPLYGGYLEGARRLAAQVAGVEVASAYALVDKLSSGAPEGDAERGLAQCAERAGRLAEELAGIEGGAWAEWLASRGYLALASVARLAQRGKAP